MTRNQRLDAGVAWGVTAPDAPARPSATAPSGAQRAGTRTLAAALALGLGASGGAWAQAAPAIPTPSELTGRSTAPDATAAPGLAATVPGGPARPVPRRVLPPEDDVRLEVKRYVLNPGAPAELTPDVVAALTRPFTGPGKSFADLADAAAAVTAHLQRELGHYLGYAYVPEQAPGTGSVRIEVLPGRLDQVEPIVCPKDLPVDCTRIAAIVQTLQPGDVLKVAEVERVVLLVNDLRGITAEFEFKPGRQPGTARLVVRPRALPVRGGRLEYSNGNPRTLGRDRVNLSVVHQSPFGRGDSANASWVAAEGLAFGLMQYTSPVGASGARVGVTASALEYRVDPQAYPVGLKGSATTLSGTGLYPVLRSRNLNWFASATAENKHYTDASVLQTSQKRIRTFSLGLTGDLRDAWLGGGISAFDTQIVHGQARYSLLPALDAPDTGFSKLTWRASRLQNLAPGRVQAYAAVRGQLAWNNLDATEQFRSGGTDGVRAFAGGEGTGDQGLGVTLELRLLPPADFTRPLGGQAMFTLFVDRAMVQPRQQATDPSLAQLEKRQDYAGWGVGVTWNHPAGWDMRSSLAKPTINQAKEADDRPGVRFAMQLGKQF